MNQSNEFLSSLKWTREAQAKLKKIPFFVRPQARQRIEEMARSAEAELVTADMVEQARQQYGN